MQTAVIMYGNATKQQESILEIKSMHQQQPTLQNGARTIREH